MNGKHLKAVLLCAIFIIISACSGCDGASETENSDDIMFESLEEAYYHKYVELTGKYGTHMLYDSPDVRWNLGRSYLNGVCIVNLIDFNGDGIQDLFVVYSNGRMSQIASLSVAQEFDDFPAPDTYEIEIWTYIDGELLQLLHETSVSKCDIYPFRGTNFHLNSYQIFLAVYENANGLPVIQIYDDSAGSPKYTNIYYSGENIIRDELICYENTFKKNGSEIAESIWIENVAGYNKILLCSFLADSNSSRTAVFELYNIDYNDTLQQTEKVIKYLSQESRTLAAEKFHIAEDEYISLYRKELLRSNLPFFESEYQDFFDNHHYALYDIDKDGSPELIITNGISHYHFYTITDGEPINCGFKGRSAMYTDGDRLITFFGRVNIYRIDEITIEAGVIKTTMIAWDYTKRSKISHDLEELGYNNFKRLASCPPAIPAAFYTYSKNLHN